MLLDAFAAEQLRLLKARWTLFWAYAFWPILVLLSGVGTHLFFNHMIRKSGAAADMARAPMDLGRPALEALQGGGFIVALAFFTVGAVSVLASDYRWETWRLLTPRNTRANLRIAKLMTVGGAAPAGLVLLMVAGVLSGLAGALINGHPIVVSATPGFPKLFAGLFLTAWADVMWMAALAACLAVITRSQVGAILATLGVAIFEGVIMGQLPMPDPTNPPLKFLAFMPGLCSNTVRNAILTGPMDIAPSNAPLAALILIAWIVGLSALAVFLFKRQDLTRE